MKTVVMHDELSEYEAKEIPPDAILVVYKYTDDGYEVRERFLAELKEMGIEITN